MHHAQNHDMWNVVIMTLEDVLSPQDMEHLEGHWDEGRVRSGFHCLDEDVYDIWRLSFVGSACYNIIMHGISGRFPKEEVTECKMFPKHINPDDSDDNHDVVVVAILSCISDDEHLLRVALSPSRGRSYLQAGIHGKCFF